MLKMFDEKIKANAKGERERNELLSLLEVKEK